MPRNRTLKEFSRNETGNGSQNATFHTCESMNDSNLDENRPEVVILTSIKANKLKICRVNCSSCSGSSPNIYKDAQTYINFLQTILGFGLITLIIGNILKAHQVITTEEMTKCALEKCHITMIALTLVFVNILTMVLFYYDSIQAYRGSVRLSQFIFLILMWSGGWPVAWIMLYLFNYRALYDHKSVLMKPFWNLVAIISGFTMPACFVLYSEPDNITI